MEIIIKSVLWLSFLYRTG